MRISTLIFIYTIHFAYLKVYTKFHNPKSSSCWENSNEKCPLKTLAPIGTEKSATEIFIGEKEKWINKETDMQYVAVFLLHNTTNHYQALYQILES